MIAMMDAPAAAVLRPHAHGIMLEMAAHQIGLMIPTLKAICAPSPVAVYGNDVPFESFNEAARFVIACDGSGKTQNATSTQIRRAAKIGAIAYGIRWKQHRNQLNGPEISCKRGRPPKVRRGPRKLAISVQRVDTGRIYGQVIDAARELAPFAGCNEKAAFMRICRSMRDGSRAFGTVWRPLRDDTTTPRLEWAAA